MKGLSLWKWEAAGNSELQSLCNSSTTDWMTGGRGLRRRVFNRWLFKMSSESEILRFSLQYYLRVQFPKHEMSQEVSSMSGAHL